MSCIFISSTHLFTSIFSIFLISLHPGFPAVRLAAPSQSFILGLLPV